MATPMFIEIQNWDSTSKRFTLAEQVSHQPTLELTTGGQTQSVDMSCLVDTITDSISLDARCDETVTPGTAEPFDDYILSGNIDTLLLEQDGTISDLLHTNAIPSSSAARGSFTMELYNPSSTDGLAIVLYAKQSSGSDSSNDYSNLDPEADSQKCATLADFLAAGEQGLPLPYVGESTLSGVPSLAENETLYASVVSNGNNSYTFTFTIRTLEVTEQELTLDLVSGENRVDMKPLLEHIGGKVETKLVQTGDFETVTLYDEQDFNPSTPGIVFPAVMFTSYAPAFLYDSTSSFPPSETLPFTLDGDSVVCEVPSSYSWYESPAVVVYFPMAPDANISSADDLLILSNISSIDNTAQTLTFSFNTVQELLDAGGTLPLNVLMNGESPTLVDDFPVQYYLHVELCEAQDGACYRFTVLTGESETKTVLHLEPSCNTDIDLDFSSITQKTISSIQASFSCPSRVDMTGISFSTVRLIAAGHAHIANPIYTFVDSQLSITRTHTGSGYNYDFDRVYIVLTKNGVNYDSGSQPFGVPFYLYDANDDVPVFYVEPCVVSSEVLVYDIYDAVPYHLAITGTNPDRKVLSSIDLDLSCLNGPGGFMAGRRSTSEVTFLPEVTVEDANRVPIGSAVFIASDCDVPPIIPPSEL